MLRRIALLFSTACYELMTLAIQSAQLLDQRVDKVGISRN